MAFSMAYIGNSLFLNNREFVLVEQGINRCQTGKFIRANRDCTFGNSTRRAALPDGGMLRPAQPTVSRPCGGAATKALQRYRR